jgi:hypothetical protein
MHCLRMSFGYQENVFGKEKICVSFFNKKNQIRNSFLKNSFHCLKEN